LEETLNVKEFGEKGGVSGWTEEQIEVLQRMHDKMMSEARTSQEVPELYRTAFNTKLIEAYEEYAVDWPKIYDLITLTKGKQVDMPVIKGIHVRTSGAQSSGRTGREIGFTGPVTGEAKIEVKKYDCGLGFDTDMLEDIEVDLMGWCLRQVGRRFKMKEDEVAFAAITARGGNMTANTLTGLNPAAIERALALLANRTVTTGGRAENEPVVPDTILVDPTHLYQAREILRTTLTVVQPISGGTTGASGSGGTNVFQSALSIVNTPFIDSTYYYIGKAKEGTVFVRRQALTIANWEDLLRDATLVRAKTRFDADCVEPSKWLRTAY